MFLIRSLLLVIGILVIATAAGTDQAVLTPMDSIVYDAGTVFEGKTKEITHIFRLKNTGTVPLIIKQVRSHCGCTVVRFDSTVAPGKTGSITSHIDLTSLRGGDLTKSITVLSNAVNLPKLLLSTRFNYQSIIAVAPDYVTLEKTGRSKSETALIIKTNRKDLKIKSIVFNADIAGAVAPLVFSLAHNDTAAVTNNSYSYKLSILATFLNDERKYGEFIIVTNHPEKPEIRLGGRIEDNR